MPILKLESKRQLRSVQELLAGVAQRLSPTNTLVRRTTCVSLCQPSRANPRRLPVPLALLLSSRGTDRSFGVLFLFRRRKNRRQAEGVEP